jgi:drug/metabolite transporter (DMT)-like permease|eukprot:COSAG06_NODE_4616_length_4097_cov_25.328914_1_plen_320_part_00
MRGRALLVGLAAVYCCASASEVLFVKGLNAKGVVFPVLTSALLNGYWPLQLVMYCALARSTANYRRLTWAIVRGYLIVGVVATGVSLLRCYGLNGLPGSTYVVLSCSDIVFNTVLSRFVLKSRFTLYHYSAVIITVAGILMLGISEGSSGARGGCAAGVSSCRTAPSSIASGSEAAGAAENADRSFGTSIAVGAALASALLSAINSVLSEFLLSKDKANPLIAVSEVSFFNSAVPSLLLPIAMTWTGELDLYEAKLTALELVPGAVVTVGCLALGLCLSKMLDRLCKFYIISLSGAFFFASESFLLCVRVSFSARKGFD